MRQAGIAAVAPLLQAARNRVDAAGTMDLFMALKGRLSDSNKVDQALSLLIFLLGLYRRSTFRRP